MLFKTFLFIASSALALVTPVPPKLHGPGCPLPSHGGPKELAAPPTGKTLKAIALGFGIQNYTCGSDPTAKATATGALAMLYDVTSLYPGHGPRSLTLKAFETLPSTVLWKHDVPLNFDPVTEDRIKGSKGASATNPFTRDAPLKLPGLDPIPFIGHHYFSVDRKPIFDVMKGNIKYIGEKIDSVDAPANADAGPDRTGAVAWLYLGALPGTSGATHLYRVLTAGGFSHGCASGPGNDSVRYAATYWFYA